MKRHVGNSFDEFLAEEGLLGEAEATAVKRVIAYQLSQFMEENKLSKSAMAKRMQTSRSALDRLLDASNPSVTLQTIDRAARVCGCRDIIRNLALDSLDSHEVLIGSNSDLLQQK